MKEKRSRSGWKTVIWRIVAVIVSYVTARTCGVDVDTSIKLVIVANTVSMMAYYWHERLWNRIEKGRE